MLISHSHRFIFFHVAKTAGLSVREVLQPYAEEPARFKIARPPRQKDGQPNPFYSIWEALLIHAKARDAQQELPPPIFGDYYKFAFVRNPWDWQVSMYHFILSEPTHIRYQTVKALGSFGRYLTWVAETPNPFAKGATKFQKDVITDEAGNLLVDFVGRYENLAQDFAAICNRLGVIARLPHVNGTSHRDYRVYYTPASRQLVEEHFAADIEMFGYTFEKRNPYSIVSTHPTQYAPEEVHSNARKSAESTEQISPGPPAGGDHSARAGGAFRPGQPAGGRSPAQIGAEKPA